MGDFMKKSIFLSTLVILICGAAFTVNADGINNKITRLGGADRYETNSLITAQLNVDQGTPVMLVNSMNFPDVLCISSIAALKHYPIVITDPASLSESAKAILSKIQQNLMLQFY